MELILNSRFSELSLDEMQAIDGGSFYNIFMRGAEILFVGTCTAIGAACGGGTPGSVLTGAAGCLVGELAWEAMFGNSLAGNLLK